MSRDKVVVVVRYPHRRPSVADLARMRAWLRFMRWLYERGQLTEWPNGTQQEVARHGEQGVHSGN